MRGKELEKFAKRYLLEGLPGFAVRGNLIHEQPVGSMLRAIFFDSSAFSKTTIYPGVFVQPLYVPRDHLTLTYGRRLARCGLEYIAGEEQSLANRLLEGIREHAIPLFESLRTPETFVVNAERWRWFRKDDCNNQWARALSLVKIGDIAGAKLWLRALRRSLSKDEGAGTWQGKLFKTGADFASLLDRDPQAARTLVGQWAELTRKALRLPE
jgi:hypothetical protein